MTHELAAGHSAAHRGAAVFARDDRVLLDVSGRAPTQMLSGLLAGAMPPDLHELGDGWRRGRAPCSAMLTPKGRMVSDMRVLRAEDGPGGRLLLVVPESGVERAMEHFGRYLPPRMAGVSRAAPAMAVVSVVGPRAADLLAETLGQPGSPDRPRDLPEDEELVRDNGSDSELRLIRSGELSGQGYDVIGPADSIERLTARLVEAGATSGGHALRELLRIERGRPAFGVEMDEDTMPGEAGILDRCVDTSKGCFTGQEVIVRIRDRGHVNRHLRGLILAEGTVSVPVALYDPEDGRPVGELRSVADHPVASGSIGLGYVRRELDPPCLVRVGSVDGPAAQVRSLDPAGWRFENGDASFYP